MTEEQVLAHQRRIAELRQGTRVVSNGQNFIKATKPKRAKFRNIRCQSHDGINFASRLERDYYEQLYLRWKAGDVLWFIRQPSFDLEGGVVYRADFLVVAKGGDVSVVDTKGYALQTSLNKIKQVRARYGIDVELIRKVTS